MMSKVGFVLAFAALLCPPVSTKHLKAHFRLHQKQASDVDDYVVNNYQYMYAVCRKFTDSTADVSFHEEDGTVLDTFCGVEGFDWDIITSMENDANRWTTQWQDTRDSDEAATECMFWDTVDDTTIENLLNNYPQGC